jgi:hypothetical protein
MCTVPNEYCAYEGIQGATEKIGTDNYWAMTRHNPLSHPTRVRSLTGVLFPPLKNYKMRVDCDSIMRAKWSSERKLKDGTLRKKRAVFVYPLQSTLLMKVSGRSSLVGYWTLQRNAE